MAFSRRSLLKGASGFLPLQLLNRFAVAQTAAVPAATPTVTDIFPSHPPQLVREMVFVSHYDQKRVRELVEARPSLANAAWDWAFGDWESALGAASHMGNRAIAEYLISKGARPSIFSAAMLGELDVVKAFLAAHPEAYRIRGPHSISLLAHARLGGQAARPVFEHLQSLGDVEDAPAPLTAEEASALVGTYPFGVSPGEQIEVDADMRMYATSKMYSHIPQLNWTRKGMFPRALFHLGNQTFYPAGAPAARVRFTQDAGGTVMSVHDPDVVLTARRKKT